MNQLLRSGPIQQKNTTLLTEKYTISPIAPETEKLLKNPITRVSAIPAHRNGWIEEALGRNL
jgi:hypothetical protein